jgi:3-deoxy-manno-octulosonate cytidylyltransferase (CMP-KDO synthetase)
MHASKKVLGVIPARLDSKRLPGKVLRDIAGKSMVHRVYENARQSPLLNDLIVATENEEVHRYCLDHGIAVTMTGRHPSGSDRLHEVMERTDGDVYVNIQGDEPQLRPDQIELVLEPILNGKAEVATLKVTIDDDAARDPNNVKVITDVNGIALYFSRYPIPFDRDGSGGIRYYKHIGLYAYTRAALSIFHRLPQSSLELAEKLEQLRYLENGIPIHVAETPHDNIGVDTEEDLQRVISLFSQ